MTLLSLCYFQTSRFWHDEKRFRGSGDDSLAQHMLFAAGGTRTGGNFKAAAAAGPMGWQVPDRCVAALLLGVCCTSL
jgi:hypothetical protein